MAGAPEIAPDRLQALYRTMGTARQLDERFTLLQRQGVLPFYLPTAGHEAVGAAIASVLEGGDWLFPGFRDLAAVVGRGVPLEAIAQQVFGTGEAPSKGRVLPLYQVHRDFNIASASAGGAAHLGQATGVAWAAKLRRDSLVALASFADGAAASGEFHAALNFAAVFAAPVVFVCQTLEPAAQQGQPQGKGQPLGKGAQVGADDHATSVAALAGGYGIPRARVDGNDVLALVAALESAVERARSGQGPTLVEAVVRPGADRDPLELLRRHMQSRHVQPGADLATLDAEIAAVITVASQAPPPDFATLFDDVFAPAPSTFQES